MNSVYFSFLLLSYIKASISIDTPLRFVFILCYLLYKIHPENVCTHRTILMIKYINHNEKQGSKLHKIQGERGGAMIGKSHPANF